MYLSSSTGLNYSLEILPLIPQNQKQWILFQILPLLANNSCLDFPPQKIYLGTSHHFLKPHTG